MRKRSLGVERPDGPGHDPRRTSANCTEKVEWGETTSLNGSLF